MTPPRSSPGTGHELAARLADYKDKQFGNWSCATLSLRWHELDEIIAALRAGVAQAPGWIDQNYQIDRYGVVLMMICEGCVDPAGLARRILAEFASPDSSTDRGGK
jgi:hypothetical protein